MSTQNNFRLTKFEIDYINDYAKSHKCNKTNALKKIIQEHSQASVNDATSFLIKEIADGVCENLSKLLTRTRLGINNADKNSQIIIELLNGVYANNPNYVFIERKQEATIQAEEVVKKRIEHFRVKKLDREIGSDT